MSIGYLKVQAVTSRGFVPVEDATVTVSGERADGGRELLNLQMTDDSGQIAAFSIDTPERANSLTPDQAQGWTDVTVRISHPDYDTIVVRSVQIFPGVTTVQEMVMIPRGALASDGAETERFDVPEQDL